MKKLKLYATGNEEERSYFKIEKKQTFLEKFRQLLKNLGCENFDVDYWMKDSERNKDEKISKTFDYCNNFKTKNCDIDIVFGKNRIIILVRTSPKNRQKFIKELMKFCEWIKSAK